MRLVTPVATGSVKSSKSSSGSWRRGIPGGSPRIQKDSDGVERDVDSAGPPDDRLEAPLDGPGFERARATARPTSPPALQPTTVLPSRSIGLPRVVGPPPPGHRQDRTSVLVRQGVGGNKPWFGLTRPRPDAGSAGRSVRRSGEGSHNAGRIAVVADGQTAERHHPRQRVGYRSPVRQHTGNTHAARRPVGCAGAPALPVDSLFLGASTARRTDPQLVWQCPARLE